MQNSTNLHTLNKTQADEALNKRLSECIDSLDEVILIEDGVYQCLTLSDQTDKVHWSSIAKTIYVLEDDAQARGISTSLTGFTFISYDAFVELAMKHHKVVSWY